MTKGEKNLWQHGSTRTEAERSTDDRQRRRPIFDGATVQRNVGQSPPQNVGRRIEQIGGRIFSSLCR
jgi:hypothetical protein